MDLSRRQILKKLLWDGPLLTLGGGLLNTTTIAAPKWQVGPLTQSHPLGLRLPDGVQARVVAVSEDPVETASNEGFVWHKSPDGGACFATQDGGWIYVSNSEEPFFQGGASAIEFSPLGDPLRAYPILESTDRNCAGGATPWGSWLSCEEVDCGYVYETDPYGKYPAKKCPALGRFRHEAVTVDDENGCLYLTEDEKDGCLYRFTPDRPFPYLDSGVLEVACKRAADNRIQWLAVNDSCPNSFLFETRTRYQKDHAYRFNGGEGIWYQSGLVIFTTKGDNRVWALDIHADQLAVLYDGNSDKFSSLNGVDNLCGSPDGRMLVAEDGGDMQLVLLDHDGRTQPLVKVLNQDYSEITGPAFSPDGSRLYFSSQRGKDQGKRLGITYELRFQT